MPYVEHTWTNGETITAAKMNNIEEGIAEAAQSGGGALIATYVSETNRLDKTVQEIYDALTNGIPVYFRYNYGTPTTNYESKSYLAPIVKVYGYNYTETLNIVAVHCSPQYIQSVGGTYDAPATIMFTASSMSSYPEFLKGVRVLGTSLELLGDMP